MRVALATLAIGIAALTHWLWPHPEAPPPAPPTVRSAKLDFDAFRTFRADQLRRAKDLAARKPRTRRGDPSKPCHLGHAEVCAALADMFAECEAQDADACLAIGQFLADTPPRPRAAASYFYQACKLGDRRGCERADQIFESRWRPEDAPRCGDDPWLCGWFAQMLGHDDLLDRACNAGVGDACATLWGRLDDNDPRGRHYLEQACRVGNAMNCTALGRRLAPDCANHRSDCYPPDAEQSAAAFAIACEAGFAEACTN